MASKTKRTTTDSDPLVGYLVYHIDEHGEVLDPDYGRVKPTLSDSELEECVAMNELIEGIERRGASTLAVRVNMDMDDVDALARRIPDIIGGLLKGLGALGVSEAETCQNDVVVTVRNGWLTRHASVLALDSLLRNGRRDRRNRMEPVENTTPAWETIADAFTERLQEFRAERRMELEGYLKHVLKRDGFGSDKARTKFARKLAGQMKGLGLALRCKCGALDPALLVNAPALKRKFAYRHDSSEGIVHHAAGSELKEIKVVDALEAVGEHTLMPIRGGYLAARLIDCELDYREAFQLAREAADTAAGATVRMALEEYLEFVRKELIKNPDVNAKGNWGSLPNNRAYCYALNETLDATTLRIKTPKGAATLKVAATANPSGRPYGRFGLSLSSRGSGGTSSSVPEMPLQSRVPLKRG